MTGNELYDMLKGFINDKSPRPGGWYMDFFLYFYDIMGKELVDVINETRLKGKVSGALSTNFIVFIPKLKKTS